MLPRFTSLAENDTLLKKEEITANNYLLLKQEIKNCLEGQYYTDKLLDTACEMAATSVNLWYQTISRSFIDKAHKRGLDVLVYTVNKPEEWKILQEINVDGFFTDFFAEANQFFGSPFKKKN